MVVVSVGYNGECHARFFLTFAIAIEEYLGYTNVNIYNKAGYIPCDFYDTLILIDEICLIFWEV